MPITLYTNFDAKYKIANSAPTDKEGADLAIFIKDYEEQYLTEVLGFKMAKEFMANYEKTEDEMGQAWWKLLKGAEFTDKYGCLNKWPGFFNTQDLSPIVPFIYCRWQRERQTYSSGSGERIVLTENSEPVTANNKIVKAWNNMVYLNFILDDFLTQNKSDYPDYPGIYGVLGQYGNINYFKNKNILGV